MRVFRWSLPCWAAFLAVLALHAAPAFVCAAEQAPKGRAAVPSSQASIIEIEEALVCQCGCGLTVHSCNHLNCPSGIPIKEEIVERVSRGESKEQIVAHFKDRYGEKVLSAPTLSGFNLLAWTAPFVLLFIGASLVLLFVRRWVRSESRPTRSSSAPLAADDPYRERLAKEISEFDA